MRSYYILCIVLFNMILTCKTWQYVSQNEYEEYGERNYNLLVLSSMHDGARSEQESRVKRVTEEVLELCATTLTTKYPKTLINHQNITKYIVNFENYRQGVSFETCKDNRGDSTHCLEVFFPGYVGECVQKYSTVRLVAVDGDTTPSLDNFVIPSHCACVLKRIS